MTTVNRRRLLQSLALAGACGTPAPAAESPLTIDVLRTVSAVNGTNFSDDQLRILKPVLERRLPELQALRNFPIDDAIEPTQGILKF